MLLKTTESTREEGFTLIELLVVIIIIGILASIAIPLFLDQRKLAIDAAVKSDVRNTAEQAQLWRVDHPDDSAANATAYLAAGGKLVATKSNGYLGVVANADGSYSVCGYNKEGKILTSASSAFTFDAKTGQFTVGSGCDGAVDANGQLDGGTGGSGAPGTTPTATPSDSPSPGTDPTPGNPPTDNPSTDTPAPTVVSSTAFETEGNYQYNYGRIFFKPAPYPQSFKDLGAANVKLSTPGTPLTDNLKTGDSVSSGASDIHVYNVSGEEKDQTLANCSFAVTVNTPMPEYGLNNSYLTGGLECGSNPASGDSLFAADKFCDSDLDDQDYCSNRQVFSPSKYLNGGYLTFKDNQGRLNRLNLTSGFSYIADN